MIVAKFDPIGKFNDLVSLLVHDLFFTFVVNLLNVRRNVDTLTATKP